MIQVDEEKIVTIGEILLNQKRPLKERFRALFSLRNIGGPTAISYISTGFTDPSALLKHELAYCLGQMQDLSAIPLLVQVLEDEDQEPIVRHEAAEALGALGTDDVIEILKKYESCDCREVAETCQLALERVAWLKAKVNEGKNMNPYQSVDPAPASDETDVSKLKINLLDESSSLFDRYRAMFALRNLQTDESALALAEGLKTESALFSHEIAFVLGQMQAESTVPALVDCLQDERQNEMVRHECAEALGAIATQDCFTVLQKYLGDEKRVVRESCEIALDMVDYENSNTFQYALV